MNRFNEQLERQKRLMGINESTEQQDLDEGIFDSIKAGIGTLGQMGKQFKYMKAVNNWNKIVKGIQKDLDTVVDMVNANMNKLQQANQAFNTVKSLGTHMAGFNQKQAVNDNLNQAFNSFTEVVNEVNQINDQMQQASQQNAQQNAQMANNLIQTANQNPQGMNQLVPLMQQMIQSLEANGQQTSQQHQQLVDLMTKAGNGDPSRGTDDVTDANDTINQMAQDGEGIKVNNNPQSVVQPPASKPVPPQQPQAPAPPPQPAAPQTAPVAGKPQTPANNQPVGKVSPAVNNAGKLGSIANNLDRAEDEYPNSNAEKPTKGLTHKQNVDKIRNKLDRFDDVEESIKRLTELANKL